MCMGEVEHHILSDWVVHTLADGVFHTLTDGVDVGDLASLEVEEHERAQLPVAASDWVVHTQADGVLHTLTEEEDLGDSASLAVKVHERSQMPVAASAWFVFFVDMRCRRRCKLKLVEQRYQSEFQPMYY